jgi:hypothetical protein
MAITRLPEATWNAFNQQVKQEIKAFQMALDIEKLNKEKEKKFKISEVSEKPEKKEEEEKDDLVAAVRDMIRYQKKENKVENTASRGQSDSRGPPNRFCYYCRQRGHTQEYCRQRKAKGDPCKAKNGDEYEFVDGKRKYLNKGSKVTSIHDPDFHM